MLKEFWGFGSGDTRDIAKQIVGVLVLMTLIASMLITVPYIGEFYSSPEVPKIFAGSMLTATVAATTVMGTFAVFIVPALLSMTANVFKSSASYAARMTILQRTLNPDWLASKLIFGTSLGIATCLWMILAPNKVSMTLSIMFILYTMIQVYGLLSFTATSISLLNERNQLIYWVKNCANVPDTKHGDAVVMFSEQLVAELANDALEVAKQGDYDRFQQIVQCMIEISHLTREKKRDDNYSPSTEAYYFLQIRLLSNTTIGSYFARHLYLTQAAKNKNSLTDTKAGNKAFLEFWRGLIHYRETISRTPSSAGLSTQTLFAFHQEAIHEFVGSWEYWSMRHSILREPPKEEPDDAPINALLEDYTYLLKFLSFSLRQADQTGINWMSDQLVRNLDSSGLYSDNGNFGYVAGFSLKHISDKKRFESAINYLRSLGMLYEQDTEALSQRITSNVMLSCYWDMRVIAFAEFLNQSCLNEYRLAQKTLVFGDPIDTSTIYDPETKDLRAKHVWSFLWRLATDREYMLKLDTIVESIREKFPEIMILNRGYSSSSPLGLRVVLSEVLPIVILLKNPPSRRFAAQFPPTDESSDINSAYSWLSIAKDELHKVKLDRVNQLAPLFNKKQLTETEFSINLQTAYWALELLRSKLPPLASYSSR